MDSPGERRERGSVKSVETQWSRKTSGRARKQNTCLLIREKRKESWQRTLTRRQIRSNTFSLKSCAVIHCSHVLQACATFRRPGARSKRLTTALEPDRTLQQSRTDYILLQTIYNSSALLWQEDMFICKMK